MYNITPKRYVSGGRGECAGLESGKSIFSEKTLYVKADFRVLTLYTYNTWRQKNKNKICTSRNLNSSETCKIWSEILLRFRKIKWKVKFLHAYLLSISKFCSTSNQNSNNFFAQNILFYTRKIKCVYKSEI